MLIIGKKGRNRVTNTHCIISPRCQKVFGSSWSGQETQWVEPQDWCLVIFITNSKLCLFAVRYDNIIHHSLFPRSPKRDTSVGVYKRHFAEPRDKPWSDQVGGSDRGGVPLPEIWGGGAVMGQEEEQQQHDLWETKSGNEVKLHRCLVSGFIGTRAEVVHHWCQTTSRHFKGPIWCKTDFTCVSKL